MIRKARIRDVKEIQRLINNFAKDDLMLGRSLNELYDNLRDFWVAEVNNKIIGCSALHISWEDLAEIKSLAVERNKQKKGIGKALLSACIDEAGELGAKKIFTLTYSPEFFKKFGFKKIKHIELPHKIWAECINCCKFPDCDEVAMLKALNKDESR